MPSGSTHLPLQERRFRSNLLDNERRVWLQLPPSPASTLCILLDGEYYVERMDAPAVIGELMAIGSIPPIAIAYVSHIDAQTRWIESFCNRTFADVVEEELIPWATDACEVAAKAPTILLGGLSLTGLAAAYVAMNSRKIGFVICQSASFWWSDNWLVHEVRRDAKSRLRFRITCGVRETTEYVDHGSGLIQRTSQIASNRAMRDALQKSGSMVSYSEFAGGHDIESWKLDLPKSIQALLDAQATAIDSRSPRH